jgi:transcription antitermination factor NusG
MGGALPGFSNYKLKLMETKWYAVYTKPRWEKKVAESLTKRKIENFCPVNTVVRQWSDRKKKVAEPLFTSYVFVRTDETQHIELKRTSGIINLVYWLNKPAIIKDREIEAIKDFLDEYKNIRLEKIDVNVNAMVRVLRGPLMEYEGNVVSINSNTVKIVLPSLGYLMSAEVERSNIEVINNNYEYKVDRNLSYQYAFK